MKKTAVINELHSLKARNLVRGLISNEGAGNALRILTKIRESCSDSDFNKALEIIRTSALFKTNAIGRDFNRTFPRVVETPSPYSVAEIFEKIERTETKIKRLIGISRDILIAISEVDWPAAISYCRELATNEGVSIFLMRVLFFIRNRVPDHNDLIKEVDNLLLGVGLHNVRYISLVIRELSSEKTDYFNISDKILDADNHILSTIARSFVDHVPRDEGCFSETLAAYYYISVFDAYLYLCGVQRLNLPFVPNLKDSCGQEFKKISEVDIDPALFYDVADPYIGFDYFRESFLIIEVRNFFNFRTVHAAIFNRAEAKDSKRIPVERALLNSFYERVRNIADIGVENSAYSLIPDCYNKNSACHFQNSCALVFLIEKRDGDITDDELGFVRLMSLTRDIGVICPLQHIDAISNNANSQELKIVATCLSHIKQRSQLKEHELRAVIQEAAMGQFDGKLTDLIGYIHTISPAVAEHLILTADETFLSKLFQLIKNPNAAIEERANILEWYGNLASDSSYLERAKNLRIDVQISREKGTIDDSRIYVDPVKFTQWVNDNIINEISLLLEVIADQPDLTLFSLNWDKVKTGMTVHDQIGSLLLKCYEEFCSNKIFGIASYLGRRIRHGTLKGTGFNDVSIFAQDTRFKNLFLTKDFDDSFKLWVTGYEIALDDLRDRYLHVQDKKKPEGMIFKDFQSLNKRMAANHMLFNVTKSFQINKSGLELPYIITEYCWRLIEEDLAAIRRFLMETKAKYAVFRYDAVSQYYGRHREVQEFCQEINSLTAEKFRTISSWFNKPSIASPSADITLLFRAVVSEIRGFFTDYNPKIEVPDIEYTLSGGSYFIIYDALYIIIYNAAKYGKKDGVLGMTISSGSFPKKIGINISIRSEIRPGDDLNAITDSIRSALAGDCEDALVVEGRSGIKKLKRLEQDNYIGGVEYRFGADTVDASFNFGIDYQS